MEKQLELTREFFSKLISALAKRLENRGDELRVIKCLDNLQSAIRDLGTGKRDASLGKIKSKFLDVNGSCCDVCGRGGTRSVRKSAASKTK